MTQSELISNIARQANTMGLSGTTVVAWVPPSTATQDPIGIFIVEADTNTSATTTRPRWTRG